MKNILITGGGPRSFIGRNLGESLCQIYNIFIPSHTELELFDYTALEKYVNRNNIDIIIHTAIHVPMFNGIEKEYFNDMLMFLNIEKISRFVEKVLYFGSGAEYDKSKNIKMAKEDEIGINIPVNEYGLAKYTMNLIARKSANIYNLRLFGVFGKYELWEMKFISNLCCKSIFGLPLTIRKDCFFDYLYIDDLISIVKWFLENNPKYHDYNICYGRPYLLSELAAMVKNISKTDQEIVLLNNHMNLDYTGDNTRLCTELNDFSFMPIKKAIEDLLSYYIHNKQQIDFDLLKKSK